LVAEETGTVPPNLEVATGYLSVGFAFDEIGATFVAHHEIFGRRPFPPRLAAPSGESASAEIPDFTPGDTVVHASRGVAVYRGLDTGSIQGVKKEFLRLSFRDGASLLVPLDNAHLVARYVGVGGIRPRLSSLGGKGWQLRRQRVREAVTDLARELIEIQVLRQAQQGIAYPADTAWQTEFENAFPFEETPDQLTAIVEAKSDMESPRPMDRLVCGDVGYGKTEIAMRAAFKAVMAGKQTAVLVPTTILAEQHYQTFSDRFAAYPIFVDVLSRFRTPAQQRAILARVAEGKTDVLIGTHRIVQSDVRFQDLGLVIIDEEQRFGVRHKEHLKRLRAIVDVLTLTATPIPRTLHMSLLGLKDISNLTTPPPGRQAIETKIIRFDPHRIASAIRRELDRDGQVFFVHDRVESIPRMQAAIEEMVPEARVGAIHGQMPKAGIRACMGDFLRGRTQVLITTTIIESGVDIPNANTIFLNNAQNFGLADLHQLRGRVGRFHRKAYAYLILPDRLALRDVAERRLRAIEEYSDLGAGFKIALRDLELRGGGNILGRNQSGHIALVGYDMYCRILREAAKELKIPTAASVRDVRVDLAVDTAVPASYTGSLRLKIWLHRRLSSAVSTQDLDKGLGEIRDRFGPIPATVMSLAGMARVKLAAGVQGVNSLISGDGDLFLAFDDPVLADRYLKDHRPGPGLVHAYEDGILRVVPPAGRTSGPELIAFLEDLFAR
jgi:transcription-repair coupling factor (superfamily II helicase)